MKSANAMLSLFGPILALAAIPLLGHGQAAPTTGAAAISGTVTDSAGVPIANATAYYSRRTRTTFQQGSAYRPSASSPDAPLTGSVVTDVAGAFRIPSLPAGNYLLCVYAPAYLDSCRWGAARTVAGLAATEARSLTPIKLSAAAVATVQVLDPAGLLPAATALDGPGTISIAIRTSTGAFFPAAATAVSGGRTYQIEVPYATSLFVSVFSQTLRLASSQGAALSNSQPYKVPLFVSEGAQPAAIVINVTGKAALASAGGN